MGISNTIFLFYQPYFKAVNLQFELYGIIIAIFSIFTAFTALYAHKIEKKLGIKGSLIFIPVLLIISLFGASLFFFG